MINKFYVIPIHTQSSRSITIYIYNQEESGKKKKKS